MYFLLLERSMGDTSGRRLDYSGLTAFWDSVLISWLQISAEGRCSGRPSQHRVINCFQPGGGLLLPSTSFGRWPSCTKLEKSIIVPLNSANACCPYHISHIIMPKLYISALLSYTLERNTSGAMYKGVPAKVPVISFACLETPTSVIFTESSSDSLNVEMGTHVVSLYLAN